MNTYMRCKIENTPICSSCGNSQLVLRANIMKSVTFSSQQQNVDKINLCSGCMLLIV